MEKVNITIAFCIFELTFHVKLTILIFSFYQICPKREFPVENGKIKLMRASMVVTILNFSARGADRHNGILISLLLVAETTNI